MKLGKISALAVALSLGAAEGASAQQVPAPATPAANGNQLEEIVVTAQRRSENLQNVPIAVTALSAQRLETAGVTSTAGLASVTPAVTFSNVAGFLEPRIRGIGNSSAGPGVENSVATYVDGVYISSSPGSLMSLSNVARVEVLKGPQGTLFGRNATGGLIQIITKDPGQVFTGNAAVGLDNYLTTQGSLYLSGPLSDKVAADISLNASHQENGYGYNSVTRQDVYRTPRDLGFRTKIIVKATDTTTLRLSFDIAQRISTDPGLAPLSGTATIYDRGPGPTFTPVILTHKPWDTAVNLSMQHDTLAGGGSIRADQDIGNLTLSSTTAYRQVRYKQAFDADATPIPIADELYTQKDYQFSQEGQLTSKHHGKLQWVLGAIYFHLNSNYDPFSLIFGAAPPFRYANMTVDTRTSSIAGYGQATYEVAPGTNLTAGIRYTQDRRTLSGTNTAITTAGVSTTHPYVPGSITYQTPTWRVSVDHRFDPDVMGYISYNRGFKSGGFNAQSPAAPAYRPEHLDAYEAGVKSQLLDDRLRLNGAVFYYNYKDVQVNTYIASIGLIYNGARAENYGVDLDFDLRPTENLSITGGLVLLHDRFTSFPLAAIATPAATGPGIYTIAPGSATGNRLPFAPDATVSLGLDYTRPVGSGTLEMAVNDLYSTGYYTQPDNVLKQGGYHMLGGSIAYKWAGARYKLSVWGNNLLNKAIAEYFSAQASGTGVSYQPPRTFGVRLGVNF